MQLYEQSNIANLSNREIADMQFHQGYSYFVLQQFAKAKPLFNSIRQVRDDPNYIDANYYYGFLSFRDKNYNEALQSFKIVENEKNYQTIVPYYIAQIYYIQGKKEEVEETRGTLRNSDAPALRPIPRSENPSNRHLRPRRKSNPADS